MKREREFYRLRGLPCPKDIAPNAGDLNENSTADQAVDADFHRLDEQVTLLFLTFISINKKSFIHYNTLNRTQIEPRMGYSLS